MAAVIEMAFLVAGCWFICAIEVMLIQILCVVRIPSMSAIAAVGSEVPSFPVVFAIAAVEIFFKLL